MAANSFIKKRRCCIIIIAISTVISDLMDGFKIKLIKIFLAVKLMFLREKDVNVTLSGQVPLVFSFTLG